MEIGQGISTVAILAVLIEALTENIGWAMSKKVWKKRMIALSLSVLVCVVTDTDLIRIIGLDSIVPFVGSILTGVLLSRGAGVLHDIISRIPIPTKEK